ncbi:MAG: PriCT-2 domain-containing protein [Proteobacteria bacterium]|nr:PriCT-2 domain-containing protein [Pseudomonadota bacterium]
MTNTYKSFGPKLVELGYDITPVIGKKPILPRWPGRPDAARQYDDYPAATGVGVLLGGKHNLVAVDVDVLNPFCSNELERLVEEELGSAPKRIGKAPKFLVLFRCTELQKKIRTGVYEIDNVDAAVEVLGEGQQFVAAGVHPDTGGRYVWPDDKLIDIAPEELTEVTPDALRRYLAMASSVMATYGSLKGRVSDRGTAAPRSGLNLKELHGKVSEVEAAVMHIPNNDEHYDDWVQTALAVKGAMGDSGFDLFSRWSARSKKDDPAQNERLWRSIGHVNRIGAGSVYYWASQHGFDLAAYRETQHVGGYETVDADGVITITPSARTGSTEPPQPLIGKCPRLILSP